MKTIKGRILLCMMLTVSISLSVVGAASIWLNYTSTVDSLEQTVGEAADIAAQRISRELEIYKNIAFEVGSVARLASTENSVESKMEIINQRVSTHGFSAGGIVGVDGRDISTGVSYTEREWFRRAMQGETYVSEPVAGKENGQLVMPVSAPLWEGGIPQTSVVGVIYFVPPEGFLNDIVGSIKMSSNTSTFLLDNTGTNIAHPNSENVKSRDNIIEKAKTDAALQDLANLEGRMIAGEKGFGIYNYEGVEKFLAYAPISGTNGWSVGIGAPVADFMSSTNSGIFLTLGLLMIAVFCSGLTAYVLAKRIGNPMKECAGRISALAHGDLKSGVPKVKGGDETAQLSQATDSIVDTLRTIVMDISMGLSEIAKGNFNIDSQAKSYYVGDFQPMAISMYEILNRLSETMERINGAAVQVANGSGQVSSGAQALSDGSTEQAASVEELAATVTEISGEVKANAENAAQASSRANDFGGQMQESNQRMREMIQAMAKINDSSQKINEIISTIENIAFQTNILALNAAVEAARAGVAGKGFAVVAEEVRSLASKSQEASKNTSELIETSVKAVENGARIADETARALLGAVEGAVAVAETIDRISEASGRQATSINQIAIGIDRISSVVQTNSATAEESAAASEELSGQAQVLHDLVAQFQIKPSVERSNAIG